MNSALTPHGPGFRFLDSFEMHEGKGMGCWTPGEDCWFFKDHFPGNPLVPAVILLEFAAQAAGVYWMRSEPHGGGEVFVASVDAFRVMASVPPGSSLVAGVECVKSLGPLAQFDVGISRDGQPVARGRIMLSRRLAGEA